MRIFSSVWGEPYLTWFEMGLVPSLFSNRNSMVTEPAKFTVATKPEYVSRIQAMKVATSVITVDSLESAFLQVMETCIREKDAMLMAPPDTIFSDGTIPNLMAYGDRPGLCVAMAHPRALPAILTDSFHDNLVAACFRHLHESWVLAQKTGSEISNSPHGGVTWQWLDALTIGVQHQLPTIYYANFLEVDAMYFRAKQNFGVWDQLWPSKLIEQNRMRYIGSSDAAFACEITDAEKNVPGIADVDLDNPDGFNGIEFHNKMFRQCVSVFRL